MPTTSNFGWTTPADTDLVKDGALAIRTLGNGIDTSFLDLKGGTTGQILSKASNTDLDYTWINNDQGDITGVTAGTGLTGGGTTGAVTVSLDSPVAATLGGTAQTSYATGDLLYASGTNTLAKRTIGTTGQVLTVSGGVPTWASPAGGGKVLQVVAATYSTTQTTTSSTYADSNLSASITPSSTSSKVLVLVSTNGILSTGSSNARGGLRLLRGSTVLSYISTGLVYFAGSGGSSSGGVGASIAYLDSPSTTSSTTYKTQVNNNGGAGTIYFQFDDGTNGTTSSIVLLEIGA